MQKNPAEEHLNVFPCRAFLSINWHVVFKIKAHRPTEINFPHEDFPQEVKALATAKLPDELQSLPYRKASPGRGKLSPQVTDEGAG